MYSFSLCFQTNYNITNQMSSPAARWRVFLYYQPHIFHPLTVFGASADDIDAGRVDTAVTENVGKLGDVFLDTVEDAGEQMTQVVRKHLVRIDVCFFAKGLHIPPDVCPADRLATARDEDTARFDPLLRHIAEQFLLQFPHDEH